MKTRSVFSAVMMLCLAWPCVCAGTEEINFVYLRELAAKRAAAPYRAPDEQLPPRLAALSYDDSRKINFRPDRTLWRAENLPFQVQFYPRGGLYRTEVIVHEVSRNRAQRIPYAPANFQIDGIPDLPRLPDNLGYAGLKVLFPLERRGDSAEVISFLGASYFRAVSAGQEFGVSARGLGLDAGIEGPTEEFPRFAEFWLHKPNARAKTFTFHALLDSPSVAGAYEFELTPGKETGLDIKAALIFRDVGKVPGIAPLTSMFWFGENMPRPEGEPRPEVHDSDGLFIQPKNGSPLWLPLQNPRAIERTEVPVEQLIRFGLAQRDRRGTSYNDPLVHYERRPTAWVEPHKNWGRGKILLAEIPAVKEYADNIVAYWVPDQRPERGKPYELNYRIVWGSEEPADHALARVVATREVARNGNRVRYEIDFADARAKRRDATEVEVEAQTISGEGARIVSATAQPASETGGWRVALEVECGASRRSCDVQCHLRQRRDVISETWRYRVAP